MTKYILEEELSSPSLGSCIHYKWPLNELKNPLSRDASLDRKSDILPMHFMLTTCIKVKVVNIVAYIAGFDSIKVSLNIIPPN